MKSIIIMITFLFLITAVHAEAFSLDGSLPMPPTADRPVDLNRASIAELLRLPGIGASRTREIIRYRRGHQFKRTSELLRIPGIGRKTFLKLRALVTVGRPKAEQLANVSLRK